MQAHSRLWFLFARQIFPLLLSAIPITGWAHGNVHRDGFVSPTNNSTKPALDDQIRAILDARHGTSGESASDHRGEHGNLDNTSVETLESTADPAAGLNARGANAKLLLAQAQIGAASGAPDQIGRWSAIINLPIVPIFTALLPNGKVLMWDSVGDGATESFPVHNFTRAAVWDPATGSAVRVDVSGFNIFCSGFAHTADGNIFVAGGNKDSALNGIRQTHLFDFVSGAWSRGPDMAFERWYPSVAALANGEHFVMGGGPSSHEVRQVDNTLRTLTGAVIPHAREYTFIQTGLDGRVIYAGPQPDLRLIDTSGAGSLRSFGNRDVFYRSYGSYAMYDVGKLLINGGAGSTNTATVVSMIGNTLTASATSNMTYGRRQHNTTVLADGTVLVTGGLSSGAALVDLNAAVYAAELWNPASGTWRELASAAVARQYHSIALLLPDGRVLTGGGGLCGVCQQAGYLRKDFEIFSPPYLFRKDSSGQLAPRPTIASAPGSVGYGQSFAISTPDAALITKAALIRLGAPTHGQDQDQRYVPLNFTAASGTLNAVSPANANIAPPGYYMLFVVNSAGVPSVSKMVRMIDAPFASTLVAKHSNQCLDVPGSIATSGVQFQQYTCNGTNAQLFDFAPVSGAASTYTIRNRANGLCVHVANASLDDGAIIRQRPCSGAENQQFFLNAITAAGAKAYQVKPVHSGKCMDVTGASQAVGAKIIQWTCHGSNNQTWTISRKP